MVISNTGNLSDTVNNISTTKTKEFKVYEKFISLDILSKSLDNEGAVKVNLLQKNLSKEKTPPLYNQIFNESINYDNNMIIGDMGKLPKGTILIDDINKIPEDTILLNEEKIEKIPEGKFNLKEIEDLTKIYGSKNIEKSYDENGYADKKKLKSILASEDSPPMDLKNISFYKDTKNLLNINV